MSFERPPLMGNHGNNKRNIKNAYTMANTLLQSDRRCTNDKVVKFTPVRQKTNSNTVQQSFQLHEWLALAIRRNELEKQNLEYLQKSRHPTERQLH
jgi:hypothetical protein